MLNAAEAHADEGRTTFLEAPMNVLIIPAKSKGLFYYTHPTLAPPRRRLFPRCLAMGGLALLLFAGCSTLGGSVDSETGGAGQDALGQPLTGFSKNPAEESVAAGPSSNQDGAAAGKKGGGRGVEVSDIYFPFDRWALMEEERKSLTASADFLKGHPKAHLLIEGYCDERGSRDYNLVLGEKRAKETRQFLIDLGIHNTVSIKSYGKERPVCAQSAESCYWQNRRAHLMMKTEP
jgi:peptidoglycan-associated lipoprotein